MRWIQTAVATLVCTAVVACTPASPPEHASTATARSKLGATAWGWREVQLLRYLPGSAMATLGSKVVLLGGENSGFRDWTEQTWEWDGTAWTRRWPATTPPPEERGYLATTVNGRVWAYRPGGANDLWEWDGETWTQRPDLGVPDPGMVIVGLPLGGALAYSGKTWLWDGTSWAEKATTHHPRTDRFQLVPLGSTVACLANDGTWEWDGSDWRLLSAKRPSGSPAVAAGSTMAIMVHDSTWVWDGTSWTENTLSPHPNNILAPASGPLQALVLDYDFATWSWDGAQWAKVAPTQSPPGREMPFMAPLGGGLLMVGKCGLACRDAWHWDGARWSQLEVDAQNFLWGDNLIGASSQTEVVAYRVADYSLLGETLRWEATGWRQLTPPSSPPAMAGHLMAGLGTSIVLFSPEHGTWVWDGVTWTQKPSSQSPTWPSWMVTAGDRVLLSDGAWTWSWDGTDWSQVAQTPQHCIASSLVDRALLLCRDGATYEWSGTAWIQQATQAPPWLMDMGMASSGSRVVLFGGALCFGFDETWEYLEALANGSTCVADLDCLSGFCVDGVCCNQPCSGRCESCALPGTEGTCSPVTGDPVGRKACPADGTLCGTSACDGVTTAVCTYPTVQCQPASCGGHEAVSASFCANGVCPVQPRQDCAPFGCSAGSCLAACVEDSDCVPGHFCYEGGCMAQFDLGHNCARGSNCTSGFCADYRCCDMACEGQCEACNLQGHPGSCLPVTGEPLNGRTSCGPGGTCGAVCDGVHRDACTFPAESPCGHATCADGTRTEGFCDSAGQCLAAGCPDAGTPDVGLPGPTDETSGCHCASSSGGPSVAWIILGFVGLLRRASMRRSPCTGSTS
ncbi:MAG: hypothetical protein QM765_31760 [Myxococcales bacterium]